MYSADEVARYVINYSYDIGYPVTNMKLQIIMYYIQAYYITKNEKCFDSDFLKFRFGPCIKSIYDTYREFTCNEIKRQNTFHKICVKSGRLMEEEMFFHYTDYEKKDRDIFELIINRASKITPWTLADYVKEESPWKMAKNYKDIINENDIKEYFSKKEYKNEVVDLSTNFSL